MPIKISGTSNPIAGIHIGCIELWVDNFQAKFKNQNRDIVPLYGRLSLRNCSECYYDAFVPNKIKCLSRMFVAVIMENNNKQHRLLFPYPSPEAS